MSLFDSVRVVEQLLLSVIQLLSIKTTLEGLLIKRNELKCLKKEVKKYKNWKNDQEILNKVNRGWGDGNCLTASLLRSAIAI